MTRNFKKFDNTKRKWKRFYLKKEFLASAVINAKFPRIHYAPVTTRYVLLVKWFLMRVNDRRKTAKFVYLRKVFSVDVGTIQNGDHLEMPLHILRNQLKL